MSSPMQSYTWQEPVLDWATTDRLEAGDCNRVEGDIAYLVDLMRKYVPSCGWSYTPTTLTDRDFLSCAHLSAQREAMQTASDYWAVNRAPLAIAIPYVNMSRQYVDATWWTAWEASVKECHNRVSGLAESVLRTGLAVTGTALIL